MSTATLTLDMTRFNAAMADLCAAQGVKFGNGTGEEGRKFLLRQGALLVDTLFNVTPPLNRKRTEDKVKTGIAQKFNTMGNPNHDFVAPEDSRHGTGSVRWYAWGSDYLYGVTKEADMTKASMEDLYRLLGQRTPKGLINAGNRGRQKIRIWQKVTVRATALKKLIARVVSHVGRLKAGWLPAYDRIKATGGFSSSARPPGPWIARHRSGARGDFREELQRPGAPSITLINSAIGIGKAGEQITAALNVRVKAMGRDMILYLKGIKQKHGIG